LELQRREHRLIQAERMASVIERTREEVSAVRKREQRDIHYNMAVVYTKEGKIREAEQEYLRSLLVDPTDPDVHYNLAILYEDELSDPRKAAMHYRRYLKLKPHGADAARVKEWLMAIEVLKPE
ncbi:tetratricopeptide repeat protein, partial [Verrucomicrobiota bacterium]